MARDSCNHTAPGSLQKPPSLHPSSSPFCPVRKKRPRGKRAEKVQAVRGLPPRAPRIHPDPMDWQKSHLFQAQRLWERAAERRWTQGEERVSVRRLGAVVWNRFFSGSHQCGSYFLTPVVRLGSGKLLLLLSLAAISPEHYFHEFPYNDSLF